MIKLIGIDPGINCGVAVSENGKLTHVTSMRLYELFEFMDSLNHSEIKVYIENPNTWRPHGKNAFIDTNRLQGAGGVKQTYKHIVEYLINKKINHVPTSISGTLKKLKSPTFVSYTGWEKKTNEHGRDAAMIIFNRKY